MKHFFFALLCLAGAATIAQAQQSPHDVAFAYMRTGDNDNAILVLTKALQQDAANQQLTQDLAMAYFYKKDYAHAKEQVKILLDKSDPDVISYQIGGNVYKALEEVKEADKMYRKALKKYPHSGPLYSEYGELLSAQKNSAAIKLWERGIEADPAYPANYYNATTYYYATNDKVWALIYGEIFVNMEPMTERSNEIKKVLLVTYKERVFSNPKDDGFDNSPFAKAVLETYGKESALVSKGLTVETLTMIRTKFILDWFSTYGQKFPYKLFDYHQQLIKEGMFEAYNQWLFGALDNLPAFDQWTKTHATAYKNLTDFQRNRVFKMPQGQFYQVVSK